MPVTAAGREGQRLSFVSQTVTSQVVNSMEKCTYCVCGSQGMDQCKATIPAQNQFEYPSESYNTAHDEAKWMHQENSTEKLADSQDTIRHASKC
ncbi:hypothetical protein PR048_023903 [Dryococelus australis]|uniref:Uncharacterized protein n=1 Tax=Dryococelus australis TaxID=614101 RepID=A0ABQ9GVD1_9NEOP|nr:hypothetical protein PR048_023903 [Dryococelus australis]